jgi:RNase H-like domain found in reverse transcriptase
VSLSLRKCHFFRRRVEYLGHVIQPGKLAMAMKKMTEVAEWPFPTKKREMKSFVAFCSVYRRFVPNFAQIPAPLKNTLKKEAADEILVTSEIQAAVGMLTECLTSPPLLSLPTQESSFILETDASIVAIGAALI